MLHEVVTLEGYPSLPCLCVWQPPDKLKREKFTKKRPPIFFSFFNYLFQVDEREYNGRVADVQLNSTCVAVLSGSKVILQRIELDGKGGADGPGGRHGRSPAIAVGGGASTGGGGREGAGMMASPSARRTFPERADREHGEATAVGLTEAFLIYATKAGTVEFFCLSEWAPLAGIELKHASPVLRLWPNYLGTRVVFADAVGAGWLYSPSSDKLTQAREMIPGRGARWERGRVVGVGGNVDQHKHVCTCVSLAQLAVRHCRIPPSTADALCGTIGYKETHQTSSSA